MAGFLPRLTANASQVLLGPGDDAAVLRSFPGEVVASTDTLVEEEDFRRDWSTAADVGTKLAAQNFADVAAMGARPVALLVSLAVPGDLPVAWTHGFADGLDEECLRAGATVIGGDVSPAPRIVLTGTALGAFDRGLGPVTRAGARPGDVVALCGQTGRSAAGLAILLAGGVRAVSPPGGDADILEEFVRAHVAPHPPYAGGPAAARAGATALIDTSDGLVRDATRLARASGVVVDLDPATLAPSRELRGAARRLGGEDQALTWVLSGGEDHSLLACFPAGTVLPAGFRGIGRILPAEGRSPGVLLGGRPWGGPTGWRHFEGRGQP